MGYSYKPQEGKDPLVELVNKALDGFVAASIPGTFLVDVLPIRKQVVEATNG